MAGGTLISHSHKLITLPLRSPSHDSSPVSLPPSKSNSDELRIRTPITPPLDGSNLSTLSASAVAEIEELLIRILAYLPSQSLLRFRCVCKRWRSMISDPFFRRLRLQFRPTALFLYRENAVDDKPELNFISPSEAYVDSMGKTLSYLKNFFDVRRTRGFHCCNGLVAIASNSNRDDSIQFFVYNPTTHRRRRLPPFQADPLYFSGENYFYDPDTNEYVWPISLAQNRHQFIALNIAFDPLKSDHYRLVYVWFDGKHHRLAIYASETKDWRDINSYTIDANDDEVRYSNGILWNGYLHWVNTRHDTVICFDFEKGCEKPILARLPGVVVSPSEETDAQWPDILFFGVCGGDLCLIRPKDPEPLMFDVFSMELDYSRWNAKYCLDLSPLIALFPSMVDEEKNPYNDPYDERRQCQFSILDCVVDEKRKQPALLLSVPNKIISYDMSSKIVKEIADVIAEEETEPWEDMSRFGWEDAFKHVETFASV